MAYRRRKHLNQPPHTEWPHTAPLPRSGHKDGVHRKNDRHRYHNLLHRILPNIPSLLAGTRCLRQQQHQPQLHILGKCSHNAIPSAKVRGHIFLFSVRGLIGISINLALYPFSTPLVFTLNKLQSFNQK